MDHGHAAVANPYSESEIQAMHRQDMAAGSAVVILMCSIFMIGVLIYTIVACSIMF